MSCGEPHETDCSEVLDHLYEYLDREMPDSDCEKFKEHFDECSPCLEKYGLEQEVKKLVKRCCGHDDVPSDLRSKVMGRIELIRAAEAEGTSGEVAGDVPGDVPAEVPGEGADRPSAPAENGDEDALHAQQAPSPASPSAKGRKKFA